MKNVDFLFMAFSQDNGRPDADKMNLVCFTETASGKVYDRLFDCQRTVKSPSGLCTNEVFDSFLDSPDVAKICNDISEARQKMAQGLMSPEEYEKLKREKKNHLPAFVFGGHSKTGKRKNEDMLPSGLALLDIDHMACDPQELYEDKIKWREKELGIAIVHKSAGGEGLHLVYEKKAGETREAANERIFTSLGLDKDPRLSEGYDKGVKDLSRSSYAVPRGYLFYVDRDLLFHRTDELQECVAASAKATSVAASQPKSNGDAMAAAASIQDDMTQEQALVIFDRVCTEIADIDIKALDTQGHRHNNLMTVLSTGITKVVPMELMLKVVEQRMPSYAPEEECKSLIKDFYGQYLNPNLPITKQLKAIRTQVLGLSSQATADDDEFDDADAWENKQLQLTDEITKLLPPGLSDTLEPLPRPMKMAMLCAVLPIAAAHASHVRLRYLDGAPHYLGMLAAVIAPSGSGKGDCARFIKPWMKKMDEISKQAFKAEDEYKEKKRNADKTNGKAPKDPRNVIQKVPTNITIPRLIYRMKNAETQDLTLCSFCEELADVLSSCKRGEWSNKRTAYLAAFDGAEWGQDCQSAESVSGMVNMHYNLSVTGTPKAMDKFFKGDAIEGGLSSRFLFASMPGNSFQPLIERPQLTATNIENINKAVEKLRSAHGTIELPLVSKAIGDWLEKTRLEAMANGDYAADYFRKRDAVIGFRVGGILSVLTDGDTEDGAKVATLISEYALGQHLRMLGKAFYETSVMASQEQHRHTGNGDIFDKLPKRFTKDDMKKLKPGASNVCLRQMIFRWTNDKHWIAKIGDNLWEKTADYATLLSRSQQAGGLRA